MPRWPKTPKNSQSTKPRFITQNRPRILSINANDFQPQNEWSFGPPQSPWNCQNCGQTNQPTVQQIEGEPIACNLCGKNYSGPASNPQPIHPIKIEPTFGSEIKLDSEDEDDDWECKHCNNWTTVLKRYCGNGDCQKARPLGFSSGSHPFANELAAKIDKKKDMLGHEGHPYNRLEFCPYCCDNHLDMKLIDFEGLYKCSHCLLVTYQWNTKIQYIFNEFLREIGMIISKYTNWMDVYGFSAFLQLHINKATNFL